MPSLSGQRRHTRLDEDLRRLHNAIFTATLVVLYYTLYRKSFEVWRSSRNFHEQPRACLRCAGAASHSFIATLSSCLSSHLHHRSKLA